MAWTTYTMLVTIAHDDGGAISPELLDTMVQRGLEESVREMHGVSAASVDSVTGDRMSSATHANISHAEIEKVRKMKLLHSSLRRGD